MVSVIDDTSKRDAVFFQHLENFKKSTLEWAFKWA